MPETLSHHAYLLVGSHSTHADLLSILEKTHKINARGNPDFFDRKYQIFTIDDAREVKTFHGTRPVSTAGKKIFIMQMNGITVEAQNSLLKLLEEPAKHAHFFVIIPSTHLLLPTMKSRMSLLDMKQEAWTKEKGRGTNKIDFDKNGKIGATDTIDSALLQSVKKFVTLSKAKKLEEIKRLIDDIAKEKRTKQDAIDLLSAIQAFIYKEKGLKEGKSSLEAVEFALTYMHDRAPSVKMLLEYVALKI